MKALSKNLKCKFFILQKKIRTLNWKSRRAFSFILSKIFFKTPKNNTMLSSLTIFYKLNHLHPFGYRKQTISRLHRTAFLNVKHLFSKRNLSKKVSFLKECLLIRLDAVQTKPISLNRSFSTCMLGTWCQSDSFLWIHSCSSVNLSVHLSVRLSICHNFLKIGP